MARVEVRTRFWRRMRSESIVIFALVVACFVLVCLLLSYIFGGGWMGFIVALVIGGMFLLLGMGVQYFSEQIFDYSKKIRAEEHKARF